MEQACLGCIIPADEDLCPLCEVHSKTSDHLLLHCVTARKMWNWWLELWGYKWVFPHNLIYAFVKWKCGKKKGTFFQKVWAASLFIIIWTLWKERNRRISDNSSSTMENLQDLILLRIGWWISSWNDGFPYIPMDIKRNPLCLEWNGGNCNSALSLTKPSYVPWSPPNPNVLKWNVDASVMETNSSSAVGGILRNNRGEFMCLFSSPIPYIEINSVEILTIHRAISISLH